MARRIARDGAWRGGRVVECTALEMRHRCKPIGGSNPSLSAKSTLRPAALSGSLRPFDGPLVPGVCQGRSYQFDSCMMAGRSGETLVARKQRSVERFGKGDVDGIIGREIVPQIPDTWQKEIMRVSAEGKVSEVGESRAAAFAVDLALCRIPADAPRNFGFERVRRMQRLLRF